MYGITWQKVTYALGTFEKIDLAIAARQAAEQLLTADPRQFQEHYGKKKATDTEYMQKIIKRICNTITTILVSIFMILAVLLWGCKLLGMDVFVVQSGSMEPEYHVGSLVYVMPVDAAELQPGDVITFNLGEGVRGTHRIIEVVEQNGSLAFRTKGDANDYADNNLITPADIIGQVKFTIPYLGFLVVYIQQPPGMYVAIAAGAFVLLLIILPELLSGDDKKKSE